MTQEQKDLLIKDLCGRLSHGVKCKILETNEVKIMGSIQYDGENTLFDFWENDQKIQYEYQLYLSEFTPYLFPLSSMTEEQKEEYYGTFSLSGDFSGPVDFYKKHHFDWRGLIPMGLALDASGLNIY